MEKTARAVIIKDNKLLVFFRKRILNGERITYYAIPGGHLELGESCEDAVLRELKEEMNLDIKILGYLGCLVGDNREEYYYHCEIVGGNLLFGGEEFDRNCEDNYYEINWLLLDKLDNSGIKAIDLVRKAMNFDYEN